MTPPLVSVVVPVFNGERFLGEALDSILRQTYRSLEAIVVDDGSTDRSADVAASRAGVLVLRQTNRGVAEARNVGARASRGSLLAFLDQDDLWEPRKLELQVAALQGDPEAGFALVLTSRFLEPGVPPPRWLNPEALRNAHTAYEPSALVVRREVFEKLEGFDTSYRYGPDTDWFFRAKDAGIRKVLVAEPLLRRRIHDSNLSHQAETSADLRRIAMESIRRQRRETIS